MLIKATITRVPEVPAEAWHSGEDSQTGRREWREVRTPPVGSRRTLAWLNRYRRLKVCYERRADICQAFLSLGCALVCWNFVQRLCAEY